MDLSAAGLKTQPFPTHGRPLAVVSYASHRDALASLHKTYETPFGICLIQGPTLCGKTTLVRAFADSLDDDVAKAIINGNGLNTATLLEAILRQFGYELDGNSPSELLAMVRVFALQQASKELPPLLIIENTHALNPSALRALCELANLRVKQASALKMVLVSDRSLSSIMESPAMEPIQKRVIADFHFHPMTRAETAEYLYTKLKAAGSEYPEFVFPSAACTSLWEASGGWPGVLDRIALLALARSETLPVPSDTVEHPVIPEGTWHEAHRAEQQSESTAPPGPPTLIVTHDGATLQQLQLDTPRMLIGRSEHNDIAIESRFVSRHHALLVRHGSATFLMDLNSTNGTFVNSTRVSNHVLVHDDVITVGHHRIKFSDPHATTRGTLEGDEFADTAIMKTLEDMRKLLAHENTEVLPAATENVATQTGD